MNNLALLKKLVVNESFLTLFEPVLDISELGVQEELKQVEGGRLAGLDDREYPPKLRKFGHLIVLDFLQDQLKFFFHTYPLHRLLLNDVGRRAR